MTEDADPDGRPHRSVPRMIGRVALGAFLLLAGISHLTWNRTAFLAQVPPWLPLGGDFVVIASGVVEIALGAALLVLTRLRIQVGWVVAAFFLVIFPGNVSQFVTRTDSFGLNSDLSRGIRLAFQPLLIALGALVHGSMAPAARPRAPETIRDRLGAPGAWWRPAVVSRCRCWRRVAGRER